MKFSEDSVSGRLAIGAAAGAVATMALQPLREATSSRFPATKPPIKQEPGEFMIERVEAALPARVRERIPDAAERAAAKSLALGYGITFGAAYALARRKPGNVFVDGAALGVVTWAAGYLGWLPATKLMPPVTRQRPPQVIAPIAQHIVFGIVAAAVVRGVLAAAERSA